MAVVPPPAATPPRRAQDQAVVPRPAELRRQAIREAVTVPKRESLVTLITRWVNNRQQPDDFYRGLLSRTLELPEGQLSEEAPPAAELAAGAEPWLLARALDASAVGGRSLDLLEEQLEARFGAHPDAAILQSLPGLGVVLGARVLGEFGDDPARYQTAKGRKAFADTAPITRSSGLRTTVAARSGATSGWWTHATCGVRGTVGASPGARRCYDAHRARGASHHRRCAPWATG